MQQQIPDRETYARYMNEQYDALDAELVANGFPPTSPWWRVQVRKFFEHPGRQAVFRVGRRGGKSSTLCRIGVVVARCGYHVLPPGERGFVAIISLSRQDAKDRFNTIKAILEKLDVDYTAAGDQIDIDDSQISFRVFTASIAGVSGFTSVCVICDEAAKWADNVSGTNPAREVFASVRPTMLTQPFAKIILSSSPFGSKDAHAKAFDVGDDARQFVAAAASWIANPTITEESTHLMEDGTDEIVWRREYAAIPQESSIAALDASTFTNLVRPLHEYSQPLASGILVLDSSSGKGDAWTWCCAEFFLEPTAGSEYITREVKDSNGIVTMRDAICYDDNGYPIKNPKFQEPKPRLFLHSIMALEGKFQSTEGITFADAVGRMCATARENGIDQLAGDQYNDFAIASEATRYSCRHISRSWTAQNKCDAAATLRRLIREGELVIEPTPEGLKMKEELASLEENILPSGAVQIASKRSARGHGDRASLCLLAALLDSEGTIAGSPTRPRGGVRSWDPYGSNAA